MAKPKPRSSSLRRDASQTSLASQLSANLNADASIYQTSNTYNPAKKTKKKGSGMRRQDSDASLSETASMSEFVMMGSKGRGDVPPMPSTSITNSQASSTVTSPSGVTSPLSLGSPMVSPNSSRPGGAQPFPVVAQRLVKSPEPIVPSNTGGRASPWSQAQFSSSQSHLPNNHFQQSSSPFSQSQSQLQLSQSQSQVSQEGGSRPRTPPPPPPPSSSSSQGRRYHITNDSISTISNVHASPPPAYRSPPASIKGSKMQGRGRSFSRGEGGDRKQGAVEVGLRVPGERQGGGGGGKRERT